MSTRLQSKVGLRRKHIEVAALEDGRQVWGAIFTSVALTGLCIATLFGVTIG